jgi:phage-related protein
LFEIAGQTLTYFKAVLWEKTGGDVIGFILKGIVGLVTSIPEKLLEIGNTAISYFKASLWVQSGKDIITKIVNGVVEFVTKIPDKLLEIAGNAITNFKAALWKDSGQRIITKIVSGIKEFFSKIPDKLMEIVKDAIAKITDPETWLQVGKDIVNGIVDGIKAIPGAIGDALTGAVGAAKDAVCGFLDINSPSKIFRDDVGSPIAEGIIAGFDRGIKGLSGDMVTSINQAKKAAEEDAIKTSRYTINGRSKQLDDMPYQIAGAVLDGVQQIADGVEKGIGKMKIVANNRETARFVADLGFARS